VSPSPRELFLRDLKTHRLLGILRDAPDAALGELASAVRDCGIRFLEVTMNTPGACRQIGRLRDMLDGSCQIGAGTVLSAREAAEAVSAGATFLVSPCLVVEVQDFADEHGIPTLPGALTPQEVWNAHRGGATMVKVFPAKSAGGPSYVKELRGPFRDIPLLACGGVNAATAGEYFRSGTDALAFGGSVFAPSRLREGDFDGVRDDLRALRSACD
jgi:2-dehydro-3-deoxyphosphogluconate aldolase/(4S)-4-hydroxy-2-oxoglutarate aldolase